MGTLRDRRVMLLNSGYSIVEFEHVTIVLRYVI
jgi:hypothetical protein